MAGTDQGSWQAMVDEHAQRIQLAAFRVTSDWSSAEDVAQDVFLALWRAPARFDGARGTLSSYLTMVGRSRAIDVQRSDAARADRERRRQEVFTSEPAGVESELLGRELVAELRSALDRLPALQRQAIELAYLTPSMTYREVAERLGEAEGTIKSRIRSGLRQLKALLHDHDPRGVDEAG